MNIRNIDKFREEMFKAVKDTAPFTAMATPLKYVTKPLFNGDPDEDWSLRDHIAHYANVDGELKPVALANALELKVIKFLDDGELEVSTFYMTIDHDCDAVFYSDEGDHFEFRAFIDCDDARSKLQFAMMVSRELEKLYSLEV